MRFQFQSEQTLPHPPSLVFAFFANPQNLPLLFPPWQRARIEQASFAAPPPRPEGTPVYAGIVAGAGSCLTVSFRLLPLLPLRLPWDALIEDFVWNESTTDIQLRGPFKSWRHVHTIQPSPTGTLLHDEITYELPVGPLNSMANWLVVRPQLRRMFNIRHQRTAKLLAAATKIRNI